MILSALHWLILYLSSNNWKQFWRFFAWFAVQVLYPVFVVVVVEKWEAKHIIESRSDHSRSDTTAEVGSCSWSWTTNGLLRKSKNHLQTRFPLPKVISNRASARVVDVTRMKSLCNIHLVRGTIVGLWCTPTHSLENCGDFFNRSEATPSFYFLLLGFTVLCELRRLSWDVVLYEYSHAWPSTMIEIHAS